MMNCQFGGISNKWDEGARHENLFLRDFAVEFAVIARLIKLKRSCFSVYALSFARWLPGQAHYACWRLFDRLARKLSIRSGKSPV